jgi:hypothetical protein
MDRSIDQIIPDAINAERARRFTCWDLIRRKSLRSKRLEQPVNSCLRQRNERQKSSFSLKFKRHMRQRSLHARSLPQMLRMKAQPVFFNDAGSIGSIRTRYPVAAKIALVTAALTTDVGASPMPPGASAFLIRCVSITGTSSIRIGR